VIAALTGLRIGELLALRWKNIDLKSGPIRVRETVHEGQFGTPKTKSSKRDVPVSKRVREAFLAQRKIGAVIVADDHVFKTRVGTPLNRKNLPRRMLQPACVKLNLPVIGWHSFRHTYATLLGDVGESLRTAQAILGHSDLETTLNVYTHAIPESQKRAVRQSRGVIVPIYSQVFSGYRKPEH
jgi:integrase